MVWYFIGIVWYLYGILLVCYGNGMVSALLYLDRGVLSVSGVDIFVQVIEYIFLQFCLRLCSTEVLGLGNGRSWYFIGILLVCYGNDMVSALLYLDRGIERLWRSWYATRTAPSSSLTFNF